jgi:hypothetical protein
LRRHLCFDGPVKNWRLFPEISHARETVERCLVQTRHRKEKRKSAHTRVDDPHALARQSATADARNHSDGPSQIAARCREDLVSMCRPPHARAQMCSRLESQDPIPILLALSSALFAGCVPAVASSLCAIFSARATNCDSAASGQRVQETRRTREGGQTSQTPSPFSVHCLRRALLRLRACACPCRPRVLARLFCSAPRAGRPAPPLGRPPTGEGAAAAAAAEQARRRTHKRSKQGRCDGATSHAPTSSHPPRSRPARSFVRWPRESKAPNHSAWTDAHSGEGPLLTYVHVPCVFCPR